MIKRFFTNLFRTSDSPQALENLEIDFVPLFVFLRRRIKQTEKSQGVIKNIEEFLELKHKDQIHAFPACYLFIEKYLLEIEEQYDASSSIIRKKIKELFPDQVSIAPSIQVIFSDSAYQELFLRNNFAIYVLKAAIEILGAKGDSHLIHLRDAFIRAETQGFQITRELRSYTTGSEKLNDHQFFKTIFQSIYDEIEDYLGETAATRLFESQYQKLAKSYAYLQSFSQLINILPGSVIDEEKINILSRSQIENLLIGKIKSLEDFNQTINSKNIELETAQREIVEIKNQYKKSANQFSTVLETIGQGIVTFDNTGIIILVNKRLEELLEYDRSELIGKSVENLFAPETLNHILYNSDRSAEKIIQRIQSEILARKKDGSLFNAEMSLSSFHLNQGVYYTAALHDITLKKIEEKRRSDLINKIKDNNTDLKNYARIVSHDIKTPIRGIKNLCNWLNEDKRDQLDEEGQEYIDLLQSKVNQIEHLVEGILAYSKAGIENSTLDQVNIQQIIQESLHLITPPDHFNIQLDSSFPHVWAEEVKIKQVFQNLISNAIKYNDKENPIINISHTEDDEFWYFHVTDNGIGIEDSYHQKVFEIFQTLGSKSNGDSTGIGLSIVKKIIDQHKGSISLESKPGMGSTFTFSIYKRLKEEYQY